MLATYDSSLEQFVSERFQFLGVELLVSLEHEGLWPHDTANLARLDITNIHTLILIQGQALPVWDRTGLKLCCKHTSK